MSKIRQRFYWLLKQSFGFLLLLAIVYFSCTPHRRFYRLGQVLYDQVERSHLPWKVIAKSVKGRNIRLLELGAGRKTTMIFGAFHGSEPLSAQLAIEFANYLYQEYGRRLDSRVVIVPIVNPDGLYYGVRTNINGVDINRNFPTENWSKNYRKRSYFPGKYPGSEPETRAVIKLIEKYHPTRIVSIHTPLRVVNYDGPARELAIRMAMFNRYPVSDDIGYPTPGSLGSYAGVERNIPTITLELPRKSFHEIWEENREALLITVMYSDDE